MLCNGISLYGEYLKGVGIKYTHYMYILNNFAKIIGSECSMDDINRSQCSQFLYQNAVKDDGISVTSYWFSKYSILMGFFKWAISRRYINHNPLPIDLPNKPKAFIPYIYNDDELKRIFDIAANYNQSPFTLYPQVVRTILMIIYFLGLRPSEALRFTLADIHIGKQNYAMINETKYYKSRVVPFNEQVASLLKKYLAWRIKQGFAISPDTYLFLNRKHMAVPIFSIRIAFIEICKQANIYRKDKCRCGPRIYDLRHTFATNRVTSWYKEGKDIQMLLPALSTFMGHAKLQSTAYYIHFTDELLFEANNKFEHYIKNTTR